MKKHIAIFICLLWGCGSQVNIPLSPCDCEEQGRGGVILLSKDEVREEEIPVFELLPGQENTENNEKQVMLTYESGYSGKISLSQGYDACESLRFTILYYARQYNTIVNRLIQLEEAEIGIEVEREPFLLIKEELPYHHRMDGQP